MPKYYLPDNLTKKLADKGFSPTNLARMSGEYASWARPTAHAAGYFVPPLPQFFVEIDTIWEIGDTTVINMNGVEVLVIHSLLYRTGIKPGGMYPFMHESTAAMHQMLGTRPMIPVHLDRKLAAVPMNTPLRAPWLYHFWYSHRVFSPADAKKASEKALSNSMAPAWYKEFCRHMIWWAEQNGRKGKTSRP